MQVSGVEERGDWWVSVPEGEGWSVEGVGVREWRGVNVVRVVGGCVK